MLLAIDVGNTQTLAGVYSGEELLHEWRIATEREATADELAADHDQILRLRGGSLGALDEMVVGSVVPALSAAYRSLALKYLDREALVLGPGVRTGLSIAIDNPHELGADRIANAVAAHRRHGGPCIVVDFGTATTFDAVSEAGEYLGGVIAPGIETSLDALAARAARLVKVDLVAPARVIGKSTIESMRSGVVYGTVAMVDGVVARMKEELGPDAARHRDRRARRPGLPPLGADRRDRAPAHARGAAHRARAERRTRVRRPGRRGEEAHAPDPRRARRRRPRAPRRRAAGRWPVAEPFEIGGLRLENRLVQAPLAGIANWAFRRQSRRHGAGLAVSEMIASFGIRYANRKTLGMLTIVPDEHPVGVQVFGADAGCHGRGGARRRGGGRRPGRRQHGLPGPEDLQDRRRRRAAGRPGARPPASSRRWCARSTSP